MVVTSTARRRSSAVAGPGLPHQIDTGPETDHISRHSSISQKARRNSAVKIFEDSTQTNDFAFVSGSTDRRGTIFSRPARKPVLPALHEDLGVPIREGDGSKKGSATSTKQLSKEARRRTIWMPQDDTTVMTIHPGAHTHTLRDDSIHLANDTTASVSLLQPQSQPIKGTAKKKRLSISMAPRSVPLAVARNQPINAILGDILGQPTGKENLVLDDSIKSDKIDAVASGRLIMQSAKPPRRTSVSESDLSTSQCSERPRSALKSSCTRKRPEPKLAKFPILEEDLEHPELYEDHWLIHQEVSLSQVINAVLTQAYDSQANTLAESQYRQALLDIYNRQDVIGLHKRLAVSIDTGALSLAKSSETPRILSDLNLQKAFIRMWVDSYDLHALKAAAEMVTARQCHWGPQISKGKTDQPSSIPLRKLLARFLMAALFDKEPRRPNEQTDTVVWQKLVLRSLTIIKVLDQYHYEARRSSCLFQNTSQHKSSESFLGAIMAICQPSMGDVRRSLGYLGMRVAYVQHPLQECTYQISNLAVDMRDGVLLARFLEILMYSSSQLSPDETTTILLPDGSTLESPIDRHHVKPLSQHLRYPARTRAQKIYNVQISLTALDSAKGLTQTAVSTIQAANIVDGHREKTLSLLWAIVSRWGLHLLIPVESIETEIRYLERSHLAHEGRRLYQDQRSPSADGISATLQAWATVACATRSITVSNLTTSFSTSAPLKAIVETYAACIPRLPKSCSSTRNEASGSGVEDLGSLLKCMGCSEAFARIFSSNEARIPTKSTTLCLLAFIASRLIPLARRLRAAETLQRIYRQHLWKRSIARRVQAAQVAHECAAVVGFSQQVEHAVLVLQRSWRAAQARRLSQTDDEQAYR